MKWGGGGGGGGGGEGVGRELKFPCNLGSLLTSIQSAEGVCLTLSENHLSFSVWWHHDLRNLSIHLYRQLKSMIRPILKELLSITLNSYKN